MTKNGTELTMSWTDKDGTRQSAWGVNIDHGEIRWKTDTTYEHALDVLSYLRNTFKHDYALFDFTMVQDAENGEHYNLQAIFRRRALKGRGC